MNMIPKMEIFFIFMIQINFLFYMIFLINLIKQKQLNLENVQMNYMINVLIMLRNRLRKCLRIKSIGRKYKIFKNKDKNHYKMKNKLYNKFKLDKQ